MKMRTVEEIAQAIAYLEVMAEHCDDDPDRKQAKLIRLTSNKMMSVLYWVVGLDQGGFGKLLDETLAKLPAPATVWPASKGCRQTKGKPH